MSLNFEALAVFAGPVILAVLVRLRLRGTWSAPRVVFAAIFALYALKAVELTLFPIPVDGAMARSFSSTPFFTFLELVPLAGITEQGALSRCSCGTSRWACRSASGSGSSTPP